METTNPQCFENKYFMLKQCFGITTLIRVVDFLPIAIFPEDSHSDAWYTNSGYLHPGKGGLANGLHAKFINDRGACL
jgi:hypothetical protein